MPPVDWDKALRHLPVQDIYKAIDGPHGVFADSMPVPTGGRMIQRAPNDPAWYKGGLWHDNLKLDVPGLWFMSWYDVSVGPNLAMFNHVRKNASPQVANQQWAVIAPVVHCAFTRATENTIVGERSMGDARLDYNEIVYGFFDKFLKGDKESRVDRLPKVTYFTMGSNQWQTSKTWPPAGASPLTFYLSSGGKANSLYGDGALVVSPSAKNLPDTFAYDPMNPVPSYGGNVCCTGNAIQAGSFDQRKMEARADILVFTSEPFSSAEHPPPLHPVPVKCDGHGSEGGGPRAVTPRSRRGPQRGRATLQDLEGPAVSSLIWTIEGLPHSSVNRISQDSHGYLWMSTFGGAVTFGGVRFEAVRLSGRTGELLPEAIGDTIEDADGAFGWERGRACGCVRRRLRGPSSPVPVSKPSTCGAWSRILQARYGSPADEAASSPGMRDARVGRRGAMVSPTTWCAPCSRTARGTSGSGPPAVRYPRHLRLARGLLQAMAKEQIPHEEMHERG